MIINLNPNGFILISYDNLIRPVLAYSFEENYSYDEQNGLATVLYNSKVITIAMTLHIVFGAIMGLMAGIFLHDQYEKVPRKRGIF